MIVIELPWPKPPLNLNQRMHWAQKATQTRLIRSTVALLARGVTIPPPCTVTLVWAVSDRRRRDTDNPAPTVKACIDGMRDAGCIAEDHSQIVTASGCRIDYRPGQPSSLRLEVRSA